MARDLLRYGMEHSPTSATGTGWGAHAVACDAAGGVGSTVSRRRSDMSRGQGDLWAEARAGLKATVSRRATQTPRPALTVSLPSVSESRSMRLTA
jgi:hypothetical protein